MVEPKYPNDFRPILLTNVRYKIITKLIVQRLSPILSNYISLTQNAFIPNRYIHHVVGIIQEITNKFRNQKLSKYYMGIKIEFKRAFDSIKRTFLYDLLNHLGFSEVFCRYIKLCTQNVTYNLRINDNLTEGFTASCGLRQGCHLSAYLFILAIDTLSKIIFKFQELCLYNPIPFANNSITVSHSVYADDCMLFDEASTQQ